MKSKIKTRLSNLIILTLLIGTLPFIISCSRINKQTDEKISGQALLLENCEYKYGELPKDGAGNYVFNNSIADTGWIKSDRISTISNCSEQVAWFRTRLPSTEIFAPAIFVSRPQDLMTVYMDGKPIFSNRDFIADSSDISDLSYRWYMIKLQENYAGKFIYFRFFSKSSEIGMSSTVTLGSTDYFINKMVNENIDNIIIGSVIILTGIGMMIILVFFRGTRFYLGLTIFCISTGLVIFLNNPYINLLSGNVTLLNYMNNLAVYSMSMLFMVVEELVLDKYKKIIRLCWQIHLAYIIAAVILSISPDITLRDVEDPYFIILLLLSNFSLFTLFKSVSKERVEAVILLIGTIIFSAFGTTEILLYYYNYYSDNWYTSTYLMHYGAFIYNIFLVVLVSYKYWKEVQQKQNAQKIIVEQQKITLEAVEREKRLHEKFTQQLIQSQDNERKKIAMELHDAVGQELLIIKNMALLSLKIKDSTDKVNNLDGYLNEISRTTSDVIENVRSLSRNLHPFQLDSLGLTKSIEAIINRVECTTNIRFTYNIENIDKLFSKEKEVHIYRMIQEIINNLIKHSFASESVINVIKENNSLSILISDNGKGFPDNTTENIPSQQQGFGISGIFERVNLLNGKIEFESEQGSGLIIKIKIPINDSLT